MRRILDGTDRQRKPLHVAFLERLQQDILDQRVLALGGERGDGVAEVARVQAGRRADTQLPGARPASRLYVYMIAFVIGAKICKLRGKLLDCFHERYFSRRGHRGKRFTACAGCAR